MLAAYHNTLGKVRKGEKGRIPGSWQKDAAQFKWTERAAAWDVAILADAGRNAAVCMVEMVRRFGEKALAALLVAKFKFDTPAQAIEAMNALAKFVPSETVNALIQSKSDDGGDTTPVSQPRIAAVG